MRNAAICTGIDINTALLPGETKNVDAIPCDPWCRLEVELSGARVPMPQLVASMLHKQIGR